MISSRSFGQQSHFIFLQAENREPFYVLLNKKTYSASSIGYLILPKLENGEYHIRLGFPSAASVEQDYILQVKDNDQGFLIKEFGEKGPGLFNLQSLDIQYAGEASKQKTEAIAKAEVKLTADGTREKTDIVKPPLDTNGMKVNEMTEIKWPVLLSQIRTDSGFIYQYEVKNNEIKDTINAYIYIKNDAPPIPIIENKPKDTVPAIVNNELPKNEPPTITKKVEVEIAVPSVTKNEKKEEIITVSEMSPIPNSNCKATADDKDFFRLRKKMVAVEDVDEMIMIAKKALKEKCYTTDHIRNLSVLFLNDAARYQFLDVAYPFTYDSYNYNSLIELLKDNYYVERFRAMIRR